MALSPAYDLNSVPEIERAQIPKTAIAEDQGDPSIASALEVAPRFGLKRSEALAVLREVHHAVSQWRSTGKQLRISAGTLSTYATAFEHKLMEEAGSFT